MLSLQHIGLIILCVCNNVVLLKNIASCFVVLTEPTDQNFKDIQITVVEEKQQLFTFKGLKPAAYLAFLLQKIV